MPRYKPARLFTHENWHFKLHIGIRYLSSKKYIQKYIFFLSNELKILSASYTTCFFILSVEKKKKRKKRKKKKERKDGEAEIDCEIDFIRGKKGEKRGKKLYKRKKRILHVHAFFTTRYDELRS